MLTACPGELPNPHKDCLHELLTSLVCYANAYQRMNIELRNLKQEYKAETDKVVFSCSEMRKLGVCLTDERKKEFQNNIENIDATTQCFTKRLNQLETERDELLTKARMCYKNMLEEKCNLKHFHEKTINHLQSVIAQSNDITVIKNCQRDIQEMSNRFLKEVAFITKTEQVLKPFFKFLHNCDNDVVCDCYFKEYEWWPKGKDVSVVDGILEEIKQTMGTTLKKAFAQVHIQKPPDTRKFLSAYIMHLQYCEEFMKEKLELFELPK